LLDFICLNLLVIVYHLQKCLDGAFFERPEIVSVCLDCFEKKKAFVDIPSYITDKIKEDVDRKTFTLKYTPPVPWIQNNEWPVCCDDYMVYIGEWSQDDFNNAALDGNGKALLEKLLAKYLKNIVENYEILWDDIGYETAAYVFECGICGKKTVICQDY